MPVTKMSSCLRSSTAWLTREMARAGDDSASAATRRSLEMRAMRSAADTPLPETSPMNTPTRSWSSQNRS